MEEINRMKEMITSIFETNSKVAQILHEWEADNNAGEEQGRRLHDLEDSIQRLENRSKEGDDELQELERMVRDLEPRVERAASLVRNYTCLLKEERARGQSTNLGTTKRPAGLQHTDGGSELPLRRDKSTTETHTVTPGHNDVHSRLSVADDSKRPHNVTSVGSQESSMSKKVGSLSENKKDESKWCSNDNGYSGDKYIKVPVNDTRFKRRLAEKEHDNKLHHVRKVEMERRENKCTVKGREDEQSAGGSHQGVDLRSMMKDEAVLGHVKDEFTRQCEALMRSAGVDGSPDMTILGTGLEETRKLVGEDPDIIRQFTQRDEHESLVRNNMEMAEYVMKMARRAAIERGKGEAATLPRGEGPDTVLCLDTSGSMEGAAFQQMISLAIKFVDGSREDSQALYAVYGIEENIGVATFGKKPGIPLHLTNQYDKVKEVLLSLKAEGPSPMFEGIYMALAACCINGRRITIGGTPVGSRIILISDGKGTPDHWHLSGDTVDPNNAKAKILVNSNTIAAGYLVKSYGKTIYSVPVGDYTERTLEQVARLSGGNIIQTNEFNILLHSSRHQFQAAKLVLDCRGLEEDVDREPFLRAIIGVESTSPGDPNFDQCKMDILTLALRYTKHQVGRMDNSGKTRTVLREVNTYMPCIGTRVRRSPTWHFGNEDHGGPGTVVGHESDSMVYVEWDGGNRNAYSYVRGIHDVTVVEEERELAVDEDVVVGCKVKRGKDWTCGDQDGGDGTVGVVCWIEQKFVLVRWPNKTLKRYRFGADGRFDVEVINQRVGSVTSASILPPRRTAGFISDKPNEYWKEMSVEDMNRLNQRI